MRKLIIKNQTPARPLSKDLPLISWLSLPVYTDTVKESEVAGEDGKYHPEDWYSDLFGWPIITQKPELTVFASAQSPRAKKVAKRDKEKTNDLIVNEGERALAFLQSVTDNINNAGRAIGIPLAAAGAVGSAFILPELLTYAPEAISAFAAAHPTATALGTTALTSAGLADVINRRFITGEHADSYGAWEEMFNKPSWSNFGNALANTAEDVLDASALAAVGPIFIRKNGLKFLLTKDNLLDVLDDGTIVDMRKTPRDQRRLLLQRQRANNGYVVTMDGNIVPANATISVGNINDLLDASWKKVPHTWSPVELANEQQVFTSKSGIKFNAADWFSRGNRTKVTNTLYLPKDVDIFNKHVTNEYLNLADDLVKEGKLVLKNGSWVGEFNGTFKSVDPVEYTIANSKAFKDAKLHWDGENFFSGMPEETISILRGNGGLESPNWSTNSPRVYGHYATSVNPGRHPGVGINMVTESRFPLREPAVRGTNPTSLNWYGGNPVGTFTNDGEVTVFKSYLDKLSGGTGTTRVIPLLGRVKSFLGNNGDFNMEDLDIFSYNGNNTNLDENYLT